MWRWKRFWFLTIFVMCITGCTLFRHALFQLGIEFALNQSVVDRGWSVQYEDVVVNTQAVSLSHVTLKTKDARLECHIDKVIIGREGVSIQSPFISLRDGGDTVFSFSELAKLSSGNIDITNAEVEWIRDGVKTDFVFALTGGKTIYLARERKKAPEVVLKLYESSEEWLCELELLSTNLQWLHGIVSLFHKELAPWEIKKGIAQGHLWIGLSKLGRITQSNGNIHVIDAVARHEGHGLQGEVEALAVDMTYPNFSLAVDVKGGRIGCKDQTLALDFALSDLQGRLNFHRFQDSEMLLKGYLDHKGQKTPIVLNAMPSKGEKETLDVDLSLAESVSLTHLNLAIAREGEDLCIVRGRLKEMGAPQIAMIQHAISFFVPDVKGFQLKKGRVTSCLSLRVAKGQVDTVLLDDLIADDLEVYWTEKDLLATCAHLSGSAKLDLFACAVPSWEVHVQNGEVLRGGYDPLRMENISMQLSVCRQVFEPSWIRATYRGIDVLLDVIGYYSEADIRMHVSTTGEELLALFCPGGLNREKFCNHQIHTDIDLHRKLGYWEVAGNVYLNVIEDWEDSLKFGGYLSDRVFEKGRWREAITKGWFTTEMISYEFAKLVSFCLGNTWLLEGMGSFKGTFSGDEIDTAISVSHANFFSPSIDIRLHPSSEGRITWNFATHEYQGNLPLTQALIHEKRRDLVFRDTRGELVFNQDQIGIKKFMTESEGVVFGGDLTYKGGQIDLEVDTLIGSARQVEALLQGEVHIPFEGMIRGLGISVSYAPGRPPEATVQLKVTHGSWEILHGLSIDELSFDFAFSTQGNTWLLTHVEGRLPSRFYEGGYRINGKEIVLQGQSMLQFDVRLENSMMDLVRLVGSYAIDTGRLELDPTLSHIFTAGLDRLEVTRDACEISLRQFGVKPFCKVLVDAGLLEQEWFGALDMLCPEEIEFKLVHATDLWSVEVETEPFHCYLTKDREGIHIDQLRVKNFTLNGELELCAGGVQISELRGQSERSSMLFQKGFVTREKCFLPLQEGVFDLAEFGLGAGKVLAMGALEIDLSKGIVQSMAKAELQVAGEVEPCTFRSLSNTTVTYTGEGGFVIHNGKLEVAAHGAVALVDIPFVSYIPGEEVWQGYQIKVQTEEGEALLKSLGLSLDLPKKVSGPLEMLLDIEFSKGAKTIGGRLGPGLYSWRGKEMQIHEALWRYDQNAIDAQVRFPFWGSEFTVQGKIYPENGRVVLEGFEKGVEGRVLYAECGAGGSIQKIQGNLFGLEFQFLPNHKMEEWTFLGNVKIDADRLKHLVDPDVKQLIEDLQFHRGYELKGELTLQKNNWAASFFEGYLKGRDFDLLGYVLKTLLANIRIDAKGVHLKDLVISDEGLSADVSTLNIDISGKGGLSLHAPEVKIDELRPSLLKKKQAHQRLKPFCIKTMTFQDVSGNLNDLKSFTGKGSLAFVNTFKEGHNLLDIPIEIISRLGLDIGLLVPIQGEMEYVLKNGKMVFTKLKNSHSESKRSYFYLWNKSESYIDFYGNMHIDIRMKQYVLFKITELFILSVQGTLEKPKCFLR